MTRLQSSKATEKQEKDSFVFWCRHASSEKVKNFMGLEFSNYDISPPVLDDYNYTPVGNSGTERVSYWQIEIIPADDDVADHNGLSKRVVHIATDSFIIYRLIHMIMVNKQKARKSNLKINEIRFSSNVKGNYFTARYLERF